LTTISFGFNCWLRYGASTVSHRCRPWRNTRSRNTNTVSLYVRTVRVRVRTVLLFRFRFRCQCYEIKFPLCFFGCALCYVTGHDTTCVLCYAFVPRWCVPLLKHMFVSLSALHCIVVIVHSFISPFRSCWLFLRQQEATKQPGNRPPPGFDDFLGTKATRASPVCCCDCCRGCCGCS